jgi:transposase InsO family protein
MVLEAYHFSKKSYGYRRIVIWIKDTYQIFINHKAVLRLMNRLGIHSIARKKKPCPKPTQLASYHRYPNLLNRDFTASQPNQKWVTDITYIRTQQGWAYLSIIKDLYDGFIVAYRLSTYQSVGLVLQTLKQAFQQENISDNLLLHSDQGFQYTSQAYCDLVQEHSIIPSMSRRGNCYDNACAENFFGHLKEEALRLVKLPSLIELRLLIDEYIYFYNY